MRYGVVFMAAVLGICFLKYRITKNKSTTITKHTIPAMTNGMTRLKILPAIAKICSIVATIGLAAPAVVAVEVARVNAVPACIIPALPPPTIIPKPHFIIGSISGKIADAVSKVPATTDAGVVTVSKILSTNGM